MNDATYQAILEAKVANPTVQVSQLCKEKGVSYQAFNNWKRRKTAGQTTLSISLEELAAHYASGKATLELQVADIVDKLDRQDRRAFATYLGLMQLETDRKEPVSN